MERLRLPEACCVASPLVPGRTPGQDMGPVVGVYWLMGSVICPPPQGADADARGGMA